jgi:hypothetical protein
MGHIKKTVIKGLTVLFTILLVACTAPFDINTDDSPPVIVIYGELTHELKEQEIRVSSSSPYFDDEPNKGISDAIVTIQTSGGEFYHFSEHDTIPGLYRSNVRFRAEEGVHYSLSVEVDFNGDGVPDKYEAQTTVLPVVTADSLSLDPIEMFGYKNYILYLYAQALPGENYYLFNVIYNDSLLTVDLTDHLISDDAFFNGRYVKGQLYIFDDISNREKDTEKRQERTIYLQSGDRIEAEIGLIPKGYYEFISQCRKEKRGENPMFGGPASNIVSNISNGGIGYFTGYSASRVEISYETKEKR